MIMGIDWLFAFYAIVDYLHKMVRFEFSGEPVIEWNRDKPRGRFIYHILRLTR